MLVIIAPAKTLDFKPVSKVKEYSLPELIHDAEKLVKILRKMSRKDLASRMNISADLADVNYERFQNWQLPFTPGIAKQAVLAFHGEVYTGLDAASLPNKVLAQAQKRLRILSGLYGVLKPLDLILPYRLEMGTKLSIGKKKDLYEFWGDKITKNIQEAVGQSGSPVLINLASQEYFKSIHIKNPNIEIVNPAFKDMKNGKYKIISIYAKKARGLMTRFILENNILNPNDLQAFDWEGYCFNPRLSKPENPVFTRG
ncbi:MAG: peroxide stress protein YaaA [Mariniphaga sp.]|nr:peroxide stress protein YaaA [Mariniphaga sp.]